MTEILTEPVAPPEETTPALATPETSETKTGAKQVEHTPGGFPVVPLSLSGTNATAGLLATAALAGGPVAAVIAMTGAAVLGTVAAHQHAKASKGAKSTKGRAASKATTTGSGQSGARSANAGRGLLGRIPAQPRTTARSGGPATAARGNATGGQARHRGGTSPRSGSTSPSTGKAGDSSARQRAGRAVAGLGGGRAGQVQALRAQSRTQTPTRMAARTAAVQARRQVADTRRAAKAAERAAATAAKPRGLAARTLAKGMGKAAAVRDKAVGAARTARDRSAGRAVGKGRAQVQTAAYRKRLAQVKAPAQKAARKALLRSAARFHARKALAGVLGAGVGLLGLVTTPLGRWLGWGWLMHPGGASTGSWSAGRAPSARPGMRPSTTSSKTTRRPPKSRWRPSRTRTTSRSGPASSGPPRTFPHRPPVKEHTT